MNRVVDDDTLLSSNNTEERDVRKTLKSPRKVWMKIGLKIDTYNRIVVDALLDSGATELSINPQLAREQGLKMDKLERAILVKNVDGI